MPEEASVTFDLYSVRSNYERENPCAFTECVTYITKYMSSTGIIMNFGRLRDIL